MKCIILGKFNVNVLSHVHSKEAFCSVFLASFIDGELQKLTVIEDCCRLTVIFRFSFPIRNDFRMTGKNF